MADARIRGDGTIDHVTAAIGLIGPSARGRQAQNGVHHVLGIAPARGWDAQLRDQLAVLLGYERAWPGAAAWKHRGLHCDASPRAGVTVGNVLTYASAGAVMRCGHGLPDDLPATHISLGLPRDGYRGAAAIGAYAWLGVDARAVAYNVFVEGNTPGGASRVERKPYGYDIQGGITVAWPRGRIGFTVVQRSREFDGQKGPDRFAQLTISLPY